MNSANYSSVQLICSVWRNRMQVVTCWRSADTWIIMNSVLCRCCNHFKALVLYLATWVRITWEMNTSKKDPLKLFCWLKAKVCRWWHDLRLDDQWIILSRVVLNYLLTWKQRSAVADMTEDERTDVYFWVGLCLAILLISGRRSASGEIIEGGMRSEKFLRGFCSTIFFLKNSGV
jgi:hypothetical protein